jgi:hypothetical protein
MREHPTVKSKIVFVLREEDEIVDNPGLELDEKDYSLRRNWGTWVRVETRYYDEFRPKKDGWVYKKYIKEIPCEDENTAPLEVPPGAIPGMPSPVPPPEPNCYPKWTGLKRC